MANEEKKFSCLDSMQKIAWIVIAVISLLTGFFTFYTKSLLSPINHKLQYYNYELDEVVDKVNQMDIIVDNNKHAVAILNVHLMKK